MEPTVVLPLAVVPPSFARGRLRLLRDSVSSGEWWLAAQLLQEAYGQKDWGPLGLSGPLSYYCEAGVSRSRASVLLTCARAGILDPALSSRKAYKLARETLAASPTPL